MARDDGGAAGTVIVAFVLGAVTGAAGAVFLHALRDAWRAHRFMEWLRGQMEGAAPRE